MSSLFNRRRQPKATHRIRSAVAAVTALAVSGAVIVATASPAQAMPRSCHDIMSSIIFFELAMDDDIGANGRFWVGDYQRYNYDMRLYYNAGC